MTKYGRTRLPALGLLLAGLTLAASPVAVAAPEAGGPVDLGTLPGHQFSGVAGIDDGGEMVGHSYRREPRILYHAAKWDRQGRISALPTLGGEYGDAQAINSGGVAVGWSEDAGGVRHAVRWAADGTVTALPAPPGGSDGEAVAISDTGTVVGNGTTADGSRHVLRWNPDGKVTDLGALPSGGSSFAVGITRDGRTVIGNAQDPAGTSHAVRWGRDGKLVELAPVNTSSLVRAVNRDGVIIGAETAPGTSIPVKWDATGRRTRLEWPASNLPSFANAINDYGIVAGSGYPDFEGTVAARWDRHGVLTVLPSETRNANAEAINNKGTAVGRAEGQAASWDSKGVLTRLSPLPGGADSYATAITPDGTVIGLSGTANREQHAVFWPAK